MTDQVIVTLSGAIKTDSGWHLAGDEITVSVEESEALEAAGVIADVRMGRDRLADMDEEIENRAGLLAEARVKEATAPLEARIKELEAELATATAATQAKPVKPAPKAKN